MVEELQPYSHSLPPIGVPTKHVINGLPAFAAAKQIESCPVLLARVTQTFVHGCTDIH